MRFAVGRQFQLAFEYVEKPLCRRRSQRSIRRELRRHLRKARAQLRPGMNHKIYAGRARQGRPYERVWRLQQVIRLQAASR
jgi:hypothetical protein